MSVALVDRALVAGYTVLSPTRADLARTPECASHPGLLRQRVPSLLVRGEVSSTKRSSEQVCHFFALVTARSEHGSIMLTLKTSVAPWGSLLDHEVLVNGRSFRMKERQEGFSASAEGEIARRHLVSV